MAQSEQLMAMTNPDLLILFEDWLEELEAEVMSIAKEDGVPDEHKLAAKLGLSSRGATFLLSKLQREGKI